jgi:hypothetical protein
MNLASFAINFVLKITFKMDFSIFLRVWPERIINKKFRCYYKKVQESGPANDGLRVGFYKLQGGLSKMVCRSGTWELGLFDRHLTASIKPDTSQIGIAPNPPDLESTA